MIIGNMTIDTTYKIALRKNNKWEYHTFKTSLTEEEFIMTLKGVYDKEIWKTVIIVDKSISC